MAKEVEFLIGLNPDIKRRKAVVNQIKANGGYCLRQTERNENTKCHCKHFRKTGECYCGLFISLPVVEVGVANDGSW